MTTKLEAAFKKAAALSPELQDQLAKATAQMQQGQTDPEAQTPEGQQAMQQLQQHIAQMQQAMHF